MKRPAKIKKYAIRVMPVKQLACPDAPCGENCAVISAAELPKGFDRERIPCLIVPFADVSDPDRPGAFTPENAGEIVDFVRRLPASVTELVCCCSAGESRSTAVAAALLKASGRSDRPVWHNLFYSPNPLVYSLLCRELGVPMPLFIAKLKKRLSRLRFKYAKLKGDTGGCDRFKTIQ